MDVLERLAEGLTLDSFGSDAIARRAAAYSVQTISEAVRRIPVLSQFPMEPWAEIKAIGNRIRHEYFRLDDAILWKVITEETGRLKPVFETMLSRCERESPAQD
ncbi:MAG: DUF86 domain-containing protein [Hyphomicrobiales bacterium]